MWRDVFFGYSVQEGQLMKMLQGLILTCALSCLGQTSHAQNLTTEQAYAAIPHARTVFNVEQSKLTNQQKDGLKRLFGLSDQGVVLKVEAMRAFQAGDKARLDYFVQRYTFLIKGLQDLAIPNELTAARKLIVAAVQDHQRFYVRKQQEIGRQAWSLSSEAQLASQKLHQAYADLLKQYPQENANNRQAFFDYLCALDFL